MGGGVNLGRVFSLEGSLNMVSVDANGSNGLGMSQLSWVGLNAVFHFGR